MRFDSQITPGHLANSFLETATNSTATFDFAVSQDPGLRQGILYEADGTATTIPPEVVTSDGSSFNGLTLDTNSPAWNVLDWSATNLSVLLATVAPGETTNLYYTSTVTITTSNPACAEPTQCESLQVAFGDPRNAGAATHAASFLAPMSLFASAFTEPLNEPINYAQTPAVGALYDPFQVFYQFVQVKTPEPFPPPTIGPIQYDINYRGFDSAVPEPGTWLLFILGFALIGSVLRRTRTIVPTRQAKTG